MQRQLISINLDTQSVSINRIDSELISAFLGGRGLADWILYREIDQKTDPLAPDNVLILSNGLLAGSSAPGSTKLEIAAKSPQTGLIGFTNVGGNFGAALQQAGFQLVIIKGKARKPTCVYINGGKVQFLEAAELWGLDTRETEDQLQKKIADPIEVLTIGPAGEKMIAFAAIIHRHHYAAGRSGMGAVMGSKNIKAIIVKKEKHSIKAGPEAKAAAKAYVGHVKTSDRYHRFATFGVPECSLDSHRAGVLGIRNYNDQQDPNAKEISGEIFTDYVNRYKSCYRCPVHCKADVKIGGDDRKPFSGSRPEWETIASLGYKCGLFQAEKLMHLGDLCNRMGMDTISTGSVLAFCMDLFGRGIISKEDTDGLELTWGSFDAMQKLIKQIAHGQGFGSTLSKGVKVAAEAIGKGAEQYAYHVKGMELSITDPRSVKGVGLGYALGPRGSDFNNVYAIPENKWKRPKGENLRGSMEAENRSTLDGKESLIKRTMAVSAAIDCLGVCKIPALSLIMEFDLKKEAALTQGITGMQIGAEALIEIGERVLHLERLINLKLGASSKEDTLPKMFQKVPVSEGPNKGMKIDNYSNAVKKFYDAMGWNTEGVPKPETLLRFGLDGIVKHDVKSSL